MSSANEKPGYHVRPILKGTIGQSSKIAEEVEELIDAEDQGVRVMVLVELSDLYGAINAYLEVHFPGFSMGDLEEMHKVTRRAFENGYR